MSKAVFTTKVMPTYDDLPESRYHFPRTYLRQVEAAVGDWIDYYEPRRSSGDLSSRGGRLAYFATAQVLRVEADPRLADHYYAYVDGYLEFDRAVSFRSGAHYYESSLRRDDGGTRRSTFGGAVRIVPESEFEYILSAEFATEVAQPSLPGGRKAGLRRTRYLSRCHAPGSRRHSRGRSEMRHSDGMCAQCATTVAPSPG